ncbi:hypothetical protein GCM10022220_43680 [Actinocatenispora rupis]|uniref:Winged helix DNA-binding domain-containing protein n=1 Tax=Actinocatenispora rupis TaxID=519421 RepID=A0A8J3NF67_9ACTN|nr:hypothetical protein Aru02nite_57910 [Actinocatenispora rupis]
MTGSAELASQDPRSVHVENHREALAWELLRNASPVPFPLLARAAEVPPATAAWLLDGFASRGWIARRLPVGPAPRNDLDEVALTAAGRAAVRAQFGAPPIPPPGISRRLPSWRRFRRCQEW